MKYRIKIITYQNGRKSYMPEIELDKKKWWFWGDKIWAGLDFEGKVEEYFLGSTGYNMDKRSHALKAIDLNFEGNTDIQTIEFEYINK